MKTNKWGQPVVDDENCPFCQKRGEIKARMEFENGASINGMICEHHANNPLETSDNGFLDDSGNPTGIVVIWQGEWA